MRIALAHDFLVQYGGAERVLEVLCEVFPEAPIYSLFYDEGRTRGRFRDRDIRTSFLARLPLAGRRMGFHHHLFFWSFPFAMARFDFSGYDVVLSSSASYSKGVVPPDGVRHICYCYTPTRYLWEDVRGYVNGWIGSPPVRFVGELLFRAMRRWDLRAARRPTRLVAVSEHISRRVEQVYGRSADGVLYPPVDTCRLAAGACEPGDYYLMVGRLLPYKRVDLGITACNALGAPLKVVGVGREASRLRRLAGPTVELLGWVEEDELIRLYRGARALIFPQVEDFGLVAAEALAAGTPVIAYRGGGALDIVEERVNGVFFDRQTTDSVVAAITAFERLQFDPSEIRSSAKRFDRARFVESVRALVAGG